MDLKADLFIGKKVNARFKYEKQRKYDDGTETETVYTDGVIIDGEKGMEVESIKEYYVRRYCNNGVMGTNMHHKHRSWYETNLEKLRTSIVNIVD